MVIEEASLLVTKSDESGNWTNGRWGKRDQNALYTWMKLS